MAGHTVSGGNISSGITLNNYDSMYVYGSADNTAVNQNGYMSVEKGGVAANTTVNSSGRVYVYSQGIASCTVINNAGYMYIESSGLADKVTVNKGAFMGLAVSGAASNITISGGGRVSGYNYNFSHNGSETFYFDTLKGNQVFGDISGLALNGHLSMGGAAKDMILSGNATLYVVSGGTAQNTAVNDYGFLSAAVGANVSGTVISNASMTMKGYADNTNVNKYGYMYVYGSADNTTVNQNGYMSVEKGGVAANTTVNSSGRVYVYSGGTHRGSLQITSGAYMQVYSKGIVDFTLTDRTTADGYLINDLSRISGTPTYTITVSAKQKNGIYQLAQGAENFTHSITIGDGTVNYGTFSAYNSLITYKGH